MKILAAQRLRDTLLANSHDKLINALERKGFTTEFEEGRRKQTTTFTNSRAELCVMFSLYDSTGNFSVFIDPYGRQYSGKNAQVLLKGKDAVHTYNKAREEFLTKFPEFDSLLPYV